MTQQEHELLCRLKEEVDGIREELLAFVKKVIVWVVLAAFALGGWSTAIQAQVLEQGRALQRMDVEGSRWSHEMRAERDGQYASIAERLGRIDERLLSIEKQLSAHMEAR